MGRRPRRGPGAVTTSCGAVALLVGGDLAEEEQQPAQVAVVGVGHVVHQLLQLGQLGAALGVQLAAAALELRAELTRYGAQACEAAEQQRVCRSGGRAADRRACSSAWYLLSGKSGRARRR